MLAAIALSSRSFLCCHFLLHLTVRDDLFGVPFSVWNELRLKVVQSSTPLCPIPCSRFLHFASFHLSQNGVAHSAIKIWWRRRLSWRHWLCLYIKLSRNFWTKSNTKNVQLILQHRSNYYSGSTIFFLLNNLWISSNNLSIYCRV